MMNPDPVYRAALDAAREDLTAAIASKGSLEQRIVRLRQAIDALQALVGMAEDSCI